MKKSVLPILCAIILSCHSKGLCQDSWSDVNKKGEGTLGVIYYQQPGLIQKDKTGELSGLCVDILNDFTDFVYKKYGKKITIHYIGEDAVFRSFIERIKTTPFILGVGNITITPEREKFLRFTKPFLTNPVILLSHKNAPDITAITQASEKFKSYTALVVDKSTHEAYVQLIKNNYFPSLSIMKVTSGVVLMNEIVKNQKTFGVIDLTEFIYAARNQLPLKRQNVKISDKNEELGFAMQLNNDWQVPWDEFLTPEYKQSTKYRKHIVNNLGSSYLSLIEM